jgi:hypothetical protein
VLSSSIAVGRTSQEHLSFPAKMPLTNKWQLLIMLQRSLAQA